MPQRKRPPGRAGRVFLHFRTGDQVLPAAVTSPNRSQVSPLKACSWTDWYRVVEARASRGLVNACNLNIAHSGFLRNHSMLDGGSVVSGAFRRGYTDRA
jgi:hypothetical protein